MGPTMTFCRANVSVAISNDRLWAVGGFNGKDFLKTVEFLDHNSEEWTNILTIDEKTEHRNTMEGGVESIEKTYVIFIWATFTCPSMYRSQTVR